MNGASCSFSGCNFAVVNLQPARLYGSYFARVNRLLAIFWSIV